MDIFIAKISITGQDNDSNWEKFRYLYNSDFLRLAYCVMAQIWFDEATIHYEYLNGATNVKQHQYIAYIYRQASTTKGVYALAKFFQGYVESMNLLFHYGLELEFPNDLPTHLPECYEPSVDEYPELQSLQ